MFKLGCAAVLTTLILTACAAGCAAPTDDEGLGDTGDSEEALSGAGSCRLSRNAIFASTTDARARAIRRGFQWLDARVPYSQRASHGGYRTDCSGFVSMCWELDRSYTTASFRSGQGQAHRLSSYEALLPGDALVRNGHIVLFLGWNDASRSGACVLEQASTKSDMQFRVRTTASLRSASYVPLRADELASGGDEEDSTEAVGDDPAPGDQDTAGSGCWSATLKELVPDLTCVQSVSNGLWYQCRESDGKWYRGVAGGQGPFGACASQHPL